MRSGSTASAGGTGRMAVPRIATCSAARAPILAEMCSLGLPGARLHHHHAGVQLVFTTTARPIRTAGGPGRRRARPDCRDRRAPASATLKKSAARLLRSGSRALDARIMDTVLNLGLNDEDRRGPLAQASGDARFAQDSYRASSRCTATWCLKGGSITSISRRSSRTSAPIAATSRTPR